jgi:hypothetical protein
MQCTAIRRIVKQAPPKYVCASCACILILDGSFSLTLVHFREVLHGFVVVDDFPPATIVDFFWEQVLYI